MGSVFGKIDVEVPRYEVVRSYDGWEIREYPAAVGASYTYVPKTSDSAQSGGEGFRPLARYIGAFPGAKAENMTRSGESEKPAAISMTAPVMTSTEKVKPQAISMTAPVVTEKAARSETMTFILPSSITIETAPTPTNADIRIHEIAPRRLAVLEFSGSATSALVAERTDALLTGIKSQGLTPVESAVVQLAQFNPPWTISRYRTNHVSIELEK